MTTKEQLDSFCKKQRLPKIDTDGCAGMTGDFGGAQIVWVDLKQKPRDLVDTVIHESVHVFQHFLSHIGEASIGKETQAYGIAHIATTLLGELENALAVHEGWETRLCEGVQGVSLEAGTETQPLGTDHFAEGSERKGDNPQG